MFMQWKVLALILRVRAKMRVTLSKMYKSREKMKLYCFLFPDDYEFDRDTLVQLWLAMGFSSQRYAEQFCQRNFDILIKEEYILFSRIDILRGRSMYKVDHDKVKSFVVETQAIENEDFNSWLENDNTECERSKFWHISVVSNCINQTTFEKLMSFGRGLRSVLFIHNYGSSLKQIHPDMFLSFEFLRALDLSGSHITEVPRSIGNARQLHYLDLSFTLIESLPESIDRLSQLQTLKLQGCKYLHELPKGMKALICLRHLEFDVLGQLTFVPEGIGALTELCTLSAFIVDSEEGSSIQELKTMNNLRGSFCISGLENVSYLDVCEAALQNKKHLTHLQLRWNDLKLYSAEDQHNAYNILATVNLNKDLEELLIINYPGLELPAWIDFREHKCLVSMTLFNCDSKELTLPLGQLPNLKYLNIIHVNRVTKIDGRSRGGWKDYAAFSKLEKLEIDCMFSVETWMDILHNDFQLLWKLVIKQCPKLIGLPFLHHLISLKHLEISRCTMFECLPDGPLSPSLETLIIDDCPLLKERCSKESEDWHKIKHVPNIWIDLEDGVEDNKSAREEVCSSPEDEEDTEDDNLTIDAPQIELENSLIFSSDQDQVLNIENFSAYASTYSKTKGIKNADADAVSDNPVGSTLLQFIPNIRSGSFADIGPRRVMEDEHVKIDDLSMHLGSMFRCLKPTAFYGIFDGHGGPEAAAYVRKNVTKFFFEDVNFPEFSELDDIFIEGVEKCLRRAFLLADLALFDDGSISTSSGTTALVALILGRLLLVANAGECRAVLCRKGEAIDMSQDHKPMCPSERRRVKELGAYIEDGYLNGVLSVTRALGDWDMKLPKGSASPLIAEPELREIILTEDDEFLIIGCDGIWDVMSSQQAVSAVRRGLRRHDDPEKCAEELVKEALRLNTCDNLTVVVICFSSFNQQREQAGGSRPGRFRHSISTESSSTLRSMLESPRADQNRISPNPRPPEPEYWPEHEFLKPSA